MTTPPPSPPNPTRGIFANLGKMMGGKAAAAVISLLYMAIAARELGVADYGALNLVHGFAVFVGGLVAFSGFHGVVSFGTRHMEKGRVDNLRQLVRAMAWIEVAMALLAFAIFIAFYDWAMSGMNLPSAVTQFGWYYAFAILATVRATPHGLLQIADRFDLISLHQTIMPMVRLLGVGVVMVTQAGLTGFLWVWLLGAVAEGASMWIMAFWVWRGRMAGGTYRPVWGQVLDQNPGLLRFITLTNVDLTMREFAPRAMPLLIGWVLGPAAAGLFTMAHRLSALFYQPAQMLGQSGYSIIVRLIETGDYIAMRHTVWKSVGVATAVSLAVAGIMSLFAAPILTLVGGAEFAAGASLLIIISFARAAAAGAPILSAALTALGRPGQSVTANTFSNLLVLPILPLLLTFWGINGAGWHVLLQTAVLMALLYRAYAPLSQKQPL